MKIRSVIVPVEVWVNWPTTRLSWPIIKRERNAYRLFPSFLVILDRGEGRRKENFDASQRRGFVHSVTSTLIVSSGGGETEEAMKNGRHFSLNIFDVEVDAVCINLSWLFTYKKLHENTLFSNIYIYILHEPIILSCLPDAYTMWEQKSNVRSKLYEIRDGGCRLIDRIANVFSRPRVKKRVKSSGT